MNIHISKSFNHGKKEVFSYTSNFEELNWMVKEKIGFDIEYEHYKWNRTNWIENDDQLQQVGWMITKPNGPGIA